MTTLATLNAARDLEARLHRLTAATPRKWGKMTAGGMLCHVRDAYEVAFGEKAVSEASNIFWRTIMKWAGLWSPSPWPRGLATRPEVEQGAGGTPPGNFEQDRERLIAVIRRFATTPALLEGKRHPLFGSMTAIEWQRWGWLHADHHLRQFGA